MQALRPRRVIVPKLIKVLKNPFGERNDPNKTWEEMLCEVTKDYKWYLPLKFKLDNDRYISSRELFINEDNEVSCKVEWV